MERNQIYEFGGFRLDPVHRTLIRPDGEPVALTPKVFETLLCLVEHAGAVVSKTALMESVWGDRVVEENSLNQHISILRRTLGESPGDNRFVLTVPGRGYQFVPDVGTRLREPDRPNGATDEADTPSRARVPLRLSGLTAKEFAKGAAAYAIVAWLLLQLADRVLPSLGVPDWVMPALAAVILGIPAAIVLAWAFDLIPSGLKRSRAELADGQDPKKKRGVDFVLLAGLAIVAGAALWNRFDTGAVANTEGRPISIAVLPFRDMSPDGDQGWLADGMADELINKLYSLEGLRVSSPTSSFSFRNSSLDIRAIGRALEVDWIVEGSVRRVGDDLRVTPTLVDDEGNVAWRGDYDRRMTDVFSIQDEIAAAVARVLGIRLDVADFDAFPGAGTRDVAAYEAYLQGTSWSRPTTDRIEAMERATAIDPQYAAAWAELGLLRGGNRLWETLPAQIPAVIDEGYKYVLHAIELDPDSWQTNVALGLMRYGHGEWIEAEQDFRKAFAMSAHPGVLVSHGNMLGRAGRLAHARAMLAEAQSIQTQSVIVTPADVVGSIYVNRLDEAREKLNMLPVTPPSVSLDVEIAVHDDDPEALRAALERIPITWTSGFALYVPVRNAFDSPESVRATLWNVYLDDSVQWPSKLHDIALLAARFGAPELALQAKSEEVRMTTIRIYLLWLPVVSEMRRLPGFKELVTEIGLVDYWRLYGWADACRPVGDDDFECS